MAEVELTGRSERVIAYLKDEMDGAERAAFEEALTRDAELRAEVERSRDVLDLLEAASDAKVVRLVNWLIREAIRRGASDIHLIPAREALSVLLRLDGALEEIAFPPDVLPSPQVPRDLQQTVTDRLKVMSGCGLKDRRLPQQGHIQVRADGEAFDLRVGVMPTLYGERVTLRLFRPGSVVLGLDRLHFEPAQLEALQRLIRRPSGFVVAAGPVGSGKTTTLYSMLLPLSAPEEPRRNVMTLEDPVEYALPGVSQTSIDLPVGLTFAGALRALFRASDPDVVMLGEVPDREMADLTLQVAATGHLVLAQLTANSAVDVVSVMRGLGADPFLLGRTLAGVVAQRLTRRVCSACAAEYQPSEDALHRLGLTPSEGPFRRGAGCEACRQTGFRGRIPLYEVLEADDGFRRLIPAEAPVEQLWQAAFGQGGSLWDHARTRVRQGQVTAEDAVVVMFDYPHPGEEGVGERRSGG